MLAWHLETKHVINQLFAVKALVQVKVSWVLQPISHFQLQRMHHLQFWHLINLYLMDEKLEHHMDVRNFVNTFYSTQSALRRRVVLICTRTARKKRYWHRRIWIGKRSYSVSVKSLQFKCQRLLKWQRASIGIFFNTRESFFVTETITNIFYPKSKVFLRTKI